MGEERRGEAEEKMRGGRIETDSLMEAEMETGRKGTLGLHQLLFGFGSRKKKRQITADS